MNTNITFRHLNPSDAMKQHVTDRMERLGKYVRNHGEAHVVLTIEKDRHHAEVIVSSDGIQATAAAETADMYASFDEAAAKVEKTLRRQHDKKVRSKNRSRVSSVA